MTHGHHGANHPVQDLETGEVVITSQNHGFAVAESSLPEHLECTHSRFSMALCRVRHTQRPAFGFGALRRVRPAGLRVFIRSIHRFDARAKR